MENCVNETETIDFKLFFSKWIINIEDQWKNLFENRL